MTPGRRKSFRDWHFFRALPKRNELFFRPAVLLAFCLVACQLACAQLPGAGAAAPPTPATPPHQDPYNRVSPESTVLSFLEAYRAKNYVAATRFLDLGKLTPEERRKQGPQLAQQLGQALDNDPQFDVAALSPNPEGDLKDSSDPNRDRVVTMHVGGRAVDLELERKELRSGIRVWRFAPETVDLIPTLTQQTAASPIVRYLPPPLVRTTFLDTALWQWIALLAAALVLAGLGRLLSRLLLALLRPGIARIAPRLNWSEVQAFVAPLQLLLVAAMFRAAMGAIGSSAIVRFYLERLLSLVSIYAIAWLCVRIVDAAMIPVRGALAARRRTITHSVIPLIARIAKLTIWVFAILSVLASWNYDTKTVLAGLGIGGIAIALAAQKTVENVFGGLSVITDHPVYVGDFCKFGDSVGTVEDIGLRSTRIRTVDRTVLTVPNAQFSSVTLENFSRQDKMLFHPKLNLRRDTTPEQVRTILAAIEKLLKAHPKVETGNLPVRFIGVGSYSLDIEIFVYILTEDGDEFMGIRQDLLLRILDAIKGAGAALAIPTQASIVYPTREEASQALAAEPHSLPGPDHS